MCQLFIDVSGFTIFYQFSYNLTSIKDTIMFKKDFLIIILLVIRIEDYLFPSNLNLEDILLHAKISYSFISMADVLTRILKNEKK